MECQSIFFCKPDSVPVDSTGAGAGNRFKVPIESTGAELNGLRSNSQQRFKISINVQTCYGDSLSWAECHVKRLVCYLQGQGHS